MPARSPHLVSSDEALSLWKSVVHALAHRLAPATREAILAGTRCLERDESSLRLAANAALLDGWVRAGHVGAIEATLAELTSAAVALALVPVDDVERLPSDPSYSFQTFVASPANAAARERARAFARSTSGALGIVGPLSSGKTHLLRAIAAQRATPDAPVRRIYRSAERLSLDLVDAICNERLAEFHDELVTAPLFLLDDAGELAGREATQEELARALAERSARGAPVAISLAKPLERTTGLIDALRAELSRLEFIDVRPPEWETRVAIIRAHAKRWGIDVSPAVSSFLASRLRTSLSTLDPLLTHLMTRSSCGEGLEDVEVVRHLLSETGERQLPIAPDDVLHAVARHFNVRLRELRSNSRRARITTPRQVAMYLVRRHCRLSYPEIGRRFGRHHTTALHSDRAIQRALGQNASLRAAILLVEKELLRISGSGG